MERRDLTGQVLDGRYRVLGPIGQGAMGSVYRAEHLKLGRIVAVKVMNEQVPSDMSARRRFEREAMAMAKLEHPHCASVLDVGMHDDQPFVVMDFVSGESLKQLVDAGPVPVPRAVEITRQILSGLSHAHEHGVIHRDIKPANIVLSQKSGLGDHVKILDFGLAKLNQESSNLTRGVIVGTPSYMAPEQIRGLLIDPRADVYACGVLLFELLTGTKPFRSANNEPVEVCMMHINTPVPRLTDRLPGSDLGALEDVVARALEKDRDSRYASAGDFASALLAAVGRPSIQTPAAGISVVRSEPPVTSHGATVQLAPVSAEVGVRGDAPTVASLQAVAPATFPAPSRPPAERAAASTSSSTPVRRRSTRTRWLAVGGGGALVTGVLAVALLAGSRGGSTASTPPAAPPATSEVVAAAPAPEPTTDPVTDLVSRALAMATAGRSEAAIDLLVKARRTDPADARLPYHAGLLYLDKMWWADGIKQLRAALELDPAYRSDPALIKAVVRGYNRTSRPDWLLAGFLRKDIGAAARPYLEETAKDHPNPKIRKRASAELRHFR